MSDAPKVGQIWADRDPRVTAKRWLKIERTDERYAYCIRSWNKGASWTARPLVRIALSRFRPTATGYDLLSETVS